jgi:murein L,D-transpeptidase YcbB/YkuD
VPAALLAGQPANREYRQLQQALAGWLTRPIAPDSAAQHQARYEQAAVNLERWRWEALPATDSAYLLVNLPACELLVVAHDSVLHRYRVIIGKPATPTPTLSSRIDHFTLAPDWHVPRSIAVKEMLPRLKEDPGYLRLNNLALYDGRGHLLDARHLNWAPVTARNFPYTIRQSAGCENALGNIVFRFANPYSIYVHDTPMRQFFAQPYRALGHGCIRLEGPMQLAAYLLRRGGQPVQLPTEAECARQPRPRNVRLRRPIALFVRYATCTAEGGHLRFLPDIYHRDEVIRRGLFGAKY